MTLTAALAIVAGVVLAAIVAHGAWSARRAGPRQPEPPRVERVEPMLAAAAEAPDVASATAASAIVDEPARTRRGPRIDALIDAIATFRFESPVTGDFVLAHLPATRRAGSKPFLVEGLDADTGEWDPVTPGRRYGELQSGLQMANRSGALNEIEYSEFAQKMQVLAENLGALVDMPDMLEVVARAKELDTFAGEHDAQLAVTLRANSVAWSPGYLQQCAARYGFVPGMVSGRLVLPSGEEHAPPVLVLNFDAQVALAEQPEHAALRDASLALDVPQTAESAEPFVQWQQVARGLADDMDAELVDDQGAPITVQAFGAIGGELTQMYQALAARDLAAGSPTARRLFS
jgi:hypothetical protein